MVITNIGLSGLALRMAGSGGIPAYIAVGTGSKLEAANVTALKTMGVILPFSTRDISTAQYISWTSDFSSTLMSGLSFKEFSLNTGSPAQEPWHYTNLGNGVQFDGSNELRVTLTWRMA
jgi:hypothetical protein